MLHPEPTDSILLEYMDPNLAQITRTWVATTIITGQPLIPPIYQEETPSYTQVHRASSHPYSLIQWNHSTDTIQLQEPSSPLHSTSTTSISLESVQGSFISDTTNDNPNIKLTSYQQASTNITKIPSHTKESNLDNVTPRLRSQKKITTFLTPLTTKPGNKTRRQTEILANQPTQRNPVTGSKNKNKQKRRKFITDFTPLQSAPSFHEMEETWGHALECIDTSKTLRIILQNPNGLKAYHQKGELLLNLQTCNSIGAGVLSLPETNTNWSNGKNNRILRETLKTVWNHSTYQTSASSESFISDYKPGGTATIVVDHWTSRVIDKGVDPFGLGRWSYLTLRGKGDKRITLVTGYRVCENTPASAGVKTAFMQQYRGISAKLCAGNKSADPNPRRQFILDLQAWLEFLIQEGHQLILTMDCNEDLQSAPGNFTTLMYDPDMVTTNSHHDGSLSTLITTCGLIDILQMHHSAPAPATYNRGNKRLDYILISQSLTQAVLRSGILPFYSLFLSDHRPCYIDIDADQLFNDIAPIAPLTYRGLQTADPRKVEKYITTVKQQLQYHKILDKVHHLQDSAEHQLWSPDHIDEYEKIDQLDTEIMRHADKILKRKFSKKYEWSPTLAKAVSSVRFWRLKMKRSRGLLVSETILRKNQLAASIPEDISAVTNRQDILDHLSLALKDLRRKQTNHAELRQNYLLELAEAIVLKRDPSLSDPKREAKKLAKKSKQIKGRERQKAMYRKIGFTLSPGQDNLRGLSRIDVPASVPLEPYPIGPDPKTWTGPWCSITDPGLIAKFVCAENTRQYNQAEQTPFGSGYLRDQIGLDASTQQADDLLQGRFIPDQCEQLMPETLDIIDQLGKPLQISAAQPKSKISISEFQAAYKTVKESTSSSPSGRHVGHYKVAATDPILSDLHSRMMSIPYQAGFSPKRWQQVTDIMLEKKEGEPKIHHLRIIALLENDYNQANRLIFARHLGHQMEDTNMVSSVQYGSRPGKLCLSAVLNKTLTYDITRQTKCTAAFIENDAIGCYDRLINPLLLLQLRRLGAPKMATQSLSQTWSSTYHHIKTLYGTSELSYGNTTHTPLFGPGQGSTLGPFLWLLLFCLIMDSLGPVPSMSYSSVDQTFQLENPGEAFVDDSFLGCTSTHVDQMELSFSKNQEQHKKSALENLTTLGQRWERLLFTTGGALNLHKSCWTLMAWKWTNGVAHLETPNNSSTSLLLTAGYDTTSPIPVPQISPLESYRTLGVFISPSGTMKKASDILQNYSLTYACSIMGSTLNREEAYTSYFMYFFPKVDSLYQF